MHYVYALSRGCVTGLDFFRTAAPKLHVFSSDFARDLHIVYKMPTSPSRVCIDKAERDSNR